MGLGKVMVLGNDSGLTFSAIQFLKEEGFIVIATTVSTLLVDIIVFQPDVLVFDDNKESLLTLTAAVKLVHANAFASYIPLILMSEDISLEKFAWDWNASAYIAKPYQLRDFSNTVKDVLSI